MGTETGTHHQVIHVGGGVPIRAWVEGVPFEPDARAQVERVARLPFLHRHVAALPDDLRGVRGAIEAAVPHGRTDNGGPNDRGAWKHPPAPSTEAWGAMRPGYQRIIAQHPRLDWPSTREPATR